MVIDSGYVVDQVLFSLFYLGCLAFFALQLLVERRAKYDQKQLSEQQRIATQRLDIRRSVAKQSAEKQHSGSNHSNERIEALPHKRDPEAPVPGPVAAVVSSKKSGSESAEDYRDNRNDSEDPNSSADDFKAPQPAPASAPATGLASARTKKPPLRVGAIQWAFHRIGLAMSVLCVIRSVDAYGIYGIYSFQTMCFLFFNVSALELVAALVAFYFPIHLVRVFALKRPSLLLKIIACVQSVFIVVLCNLIPALFSPYGSTGTLRGIFYLSSAIFLYVTVLVCAIYMHRLHSAVNDLILYHSKMDARLRGEDGSGPQPKAFDADSNEPAQPSVPVPRSADDIDSRISVTVDPIAVITPAAHPPPSRDSSAHSLLLAPSSASTAANTPSVPIRRLEANSAAFASGENAAAIELEPRGAASPSRSDSVVAQPIAIATLTVTSSDPSRRGPSKANPAIAKYREMLRRMRIFQVLASVGCLVIASFLANSAAKNIRNGGTLGKLGDAADYSSSFSFFVINVANLFGLLLGGWYAYMPIGALCSRWAAA